MEFLWVHQFEKLEIPSGWQQSSLDILKFAPMAAPGAFGFVNPDDALRGCYLIPRFCTGLTVFILEQVPAGSVSEACKYQVLEAPFRRWFRNFPAPFRDGTGTLSVTASDSSRALPRLGSIGSIGKSSYFTFLTSNL